MYGPALFAALSTVRFAVALGDQIIKAESCSWSPLVVEDRVTCVAPQPKQKPPLLFEVETPELWTSEHDRYERPRNYKLPPAWNGPEHCFAEFCLFSNPDAGEGMSLITTARNAYVTANSFIPRSVGIEPTAYYETEVPGKGTGLIANRTIRKGEIIMQRAPAMLIQSTPHLDLEPEVREKLYRDAVDRLPEPTRGRFLRQMGDTIYDKVEKNSFRMFVDGDRKQSLHLGLFPEVSKFNHDCRPNIFYRIANLTHTTVAVRDIPAGEELTVSYIFSQTPRSERQTQLSDWGFNCSCSQCTLSALESGASDARIRQIDALEEEIESIMSKPGAEGMRPEMGGKLVELYLAERLDSYLGPTYTRAALIYSMFGNEERAREYANEAVAALERETGPHARDIESMAWLAENPKAHWSWAVKVTSGRGDTAGNKTRERGKQG